MLPLNIGGILDECVSRRMPVAGAGPGFGPSGFRLNLFQISILIDTTLSEKAE